MAIINQNNPYRTGFELKKNRKIRREMRWHAIYRSGVWRAIYRPGVWRAIYRPGVWRAIYRSGVWRGRRDDLQNPFRQAKRVAKD